jgi:hypothetical protein
MGALEPPMKSVFVIALLTFTFLSGCMKYMTMDYPFDDRKFDSTAWKSYHKNMDHDNPRGQMVDDLFNHLRKGFSREEITRLLGEPDLEVKDNFFSYNLGMWSGFRMDYDSFDLEFDNSGKLLKYYRVQR